MNKVAISRKSTEQSTSQINYSDAPKLDRRFFANAIAVQPDTLLAALGSGPKQQITLRIDQDVIKFFRAQGKGYQRLMNFALRAYMLRQKTTGEQAATKKRRPRSA